LGTRSGSLSCQLPVASQKPADQIDPVVSLARNWKREQRANWELATSFLGRPT
jgi:hypothetical protein